MWKTSNSDAEKAEDDADGAEHEGDRIAHEHDEREHEEHEHREVVAHPVDHGVDLPQLGSRAARPAWLSRPARAGRTGRRCGAQPTESDRQQHGPEAEVAGSP